MHRGFVTEMMSNAAFSIVVYLGARGLDSFVYKEKITVRMLELPKSNVFLYLYTYGDKSRKELLENTSLYLKNFL
ncbi:hypothetical protein WN55_06700 [Dufourea novaeangliae]|uniref:Uncharacterized protein n=1 Tax=Dufourea novaeangliae TaxID=178035 RepID=A0A154PQQ3_DUFNO|nr:hypothetical protein WN55_06700 [Dufourea novaeangliae]